MILALTVTEEVKKRLLAWFMSGTLPLNIPFPYFEPHPWAKQFLDCSTLVFPAGSPLPFTLQISLENSPLAGYGKKTGFYFYEYWA